MKERDEIEKMFSDAFSDEKVVVPASVKAGIDKKIGTKGIAGWKVFGVATLVGAVSIGIWKFSGSTNLSNLKIAENQDDIEIKFDNSSSEKLDNSANQKNENANREVKYEVQDSYDNFEQVNNTNENVKSNTSSFSEGSNSVKNNYSNKYAKANLISNKMSSNSGSLTRKNVTNGKSNSLKSGNDSELNGSMTNSPNFYVNKSNFNSTATNQPGVQNNGANSTTGDATNIKLNLTKNGILKKDQTSSLADMKSQNISFEFGKDEVFTNHLSSNSDIQPTLKIQAPTLFEDHLNKELTSEDLEAVQPITLINSKKRNISWELGLYAGIYNSYNNKADSNSTRNHWNSQIGFETSLQAKLRFRPRLVVGLGIGYGQNKLNISEETPITSIDSIPGSWIPDPDDSTGQDSLFIPSNQWDTTSTNLSVEGRYMVSKISIPVYFEYRQPLFKTFYLDVALGARFNIQSWKSENSPFSPTLSKFNMDVMLRPQLTYEIRKFSVGIYGRLDYTPFGLSNWNSLRANSVRGGLGINLSYRF